MKRSILFALFVLMLSASVAMAAESFPNLELKGQLTPEQQSYLGVGSDAFSLKDIKAEYLFIEGYSMYCPICQRDAKPLNEMYDAVTAADKDGKLKVIGLALGNTPYEVSFYQKKYEVAFPLFSDEDYKIHKALDEVPTPTFYIVKLETMEVVYKKIGAAETKEVLLKAIEDATGLK